MVLDYDLDSSSVDFHYDLGTVMITKSLSPALHSLSLGYAFSSISSRPVQIEMALENGLSPDCLDVMLTGRHVRTLTASQIGEPGVFRWDGLNRDGQPVAGGVYFVRVSLGSRHLTGKIAILR
jgi:hypothetical protein